MAGIGSTVREALDALARPTNSIHLGSGRSARVRLESLEASRLLGWEPDWKAHIMSVLLAHNPGRFIDVGANMGQTLLDYLSLGQTEGYTGFEPNPRAFSQVDAIIRENRLASCWVMPVGLSDAPAVVRLYARRGHRFDPAASIVDGLRPGSEFEPLFVPVFRFDDVAQEATGGARIGLVKIDVEGAELGVLRGMAGALAADRPWIICEVLRRDGQADAVRHGAKQRELAEFLQRIGHRIFRLVKSPAADRVVAFEPMETFPEDAWTQESAEACDYVFAPEGASLPRLGHDA